MKRAIATQSDDAFPRLVADIGGTNARFALETTPYTLTQVQVLACANYDSLLAAIRAYVSEQGIRLPKHMGVAIANPVNGDSVQMTNHHWQFAISEMHKALNCETFHVVNDFTAQALAITQMSAANMIHLNGPQATESKPESGAESSGAICKHLPCAVIGAGTGLGVSGLIPAGQARMVALSGEGGHVSFSPADDLECDLLNYARERFGVHVSTERLLQGEGLVLLYQFFAERTQQVAVKQTPAGITHGALVDKDTLCLQVLSRYCQILGSFCANVALTMGAVGGVYLAGGIVPRFTAFLRQSSFRQRFEAKGRFTGYLSAIPVYVVDDPHAGLLGAAVSLNNHLNLPPVPR